MFTQIGESMQALALNPTSHDTFISREDSMHDYRTEIPNIIFEMKLDPYEMTTYCHLKKAAGDHGGCWKSSKTLCEDMGISHPKLIQIKKSLEYKGLIRVEKRVHENGGSMSDFVTVTDIWHMNMKTMVDRFSSKKGGKRHLGGGVNMVNGGGKYGLPKEDPIQEEPLEEQQPPTPKIVEPPVTQTVVVSSVSSDRNTTQIQKEKQSIYIELHPVDIPEQEKMQITRNFSLAQVQHALKCVASSKFPIRCLAAFIKKACACQWEMQPSAEDLVHINKSYAMRYNGVIVKSVEISALNKYVEVNNKSHPNGASCIQYDDPKFIPQFQDALRKNNIKVLEIR